MFVYQSTTHHPRCYCLLHEDGGTEPRHYIEEVLGVCRQCLPGHLFWQTLFPNHALSALAIFFFLFRGIPLTNLKHLKWLQTVYFRSSRDKTVYVQRSLQATYKHFIKSIQKHVFFQRFISTLRRCRALSKKNHFLWIRKIHLGNVFKTSICCEYLAFKCHILGAKPLFRNIRKSKSPCSALTKSGKNTQNLKKSEF